MKTKMTYLMLAAISLVGISSSSAEARMTRAPHQVAVAQLEVVEIDRDHGGLQNVVSGDISINLSTGRVKLFLVRKNNCPEGRLCMAMMPAPFMLDLPLVKTETNECNVTIYTALKDQRPVDGALQEITVIDNSRNSCPTLHHLLALPATEVEYHSVSAGFGGPVIDATSRFRGPALHIIHL